MKYNITIQGRGGHGSRPDRSYNPVDCFAAAFGVMQLHDCKISQVDGGSAVNVIPDKLTFLMESSTDSQKLQLVLDPIGKLYNCSFEIAVL